MSNVIVYRCRRSEWGSSSYNSYYLMDSTHHYNVLTDYQREVMNIFNHAWSDITDLDDLLYIQVPSYNYNARESVSVDMHFTVKLIKLLFFFSVWKLHLLNFFFDCTKVEYDYKSLHYVFYLHSHSIIFMKILWVFPFYFTLFQGKYCYLGSLIVECFAVDHHRK